MRRAFDPFGSPSAGSNPTPTMRRGWRTLWHGWRFFAGACFITACLLLPLAPARAVVVGMGLAAVIRLATKMSATDS